MRMRYVITICMMIWSGFASAQVSGDCYLEGQLDHSGTTVLFTAASVSAVTDSTLTDSAGAYALTLEVGLYDVSYRHDGYLPLILPDPVLVTMSPMTLADVNLEAGQVIELSGTTGDLHLSSGTIVRIVGFTRVAAGDSLTVDPGVRFLFSGHDAFIIDGYADFNGTETDSIIFESEIPGAGANAWSELSIRSADVRMQYCVLRQGNNLNLDNQGGGPPVEIDHCRIEHMSTGIYMTFGAIFHIRDCVIENTLSSAVRVSLTPGAYEDHLFERCLFRNTLYGNISAIKVLDTSALRLVDCTIDADDPAKMPYYGVEIQSNASVELMGCTISDCESAGVKVASGGPLLVESCLITGNGTGVDGEAMALGVVRNNTIIGNTLHGLRYQGLDDEVSHNILWGNGIGIQFDSSSGTIIYNDIQGNGVDFAGEFIPSYFGETITTNANGDPADIYLNIFLSPDFVDVAGGDYSLLATSPCIDAGDPARLDPDGTAADLGAYFFDQNVSGVQVPSLPGPGISCSPNPFNPATTITYNLPRDGYVDLSVFNLRGQLVAVLVDGFAMAGPSSVLWDGTDWSGRHCASGAYFLRLANGGEVVTGKILLAK